MPNYRAVSAGTIPPPPTPKHAFKIATQNSFDYSSFVFACITSALAEWTDAHPQLGEGMTGYGGYFWRGFLDKTDRNCMVIFACRRFSMKMSVTTPKVRALSGSEAFTPHPYSHHARLLRTQYVQRFRNSGPRHRAGYLDYVLPESGPHCGSARRKARICSGPGRPDKRLS